MKNELNKKVYNVEVYNDMSQYTIRSLDKQDINHIYFKIDALIKNKIEFENGPLGTVFWYLKPEFKNDWQYDLPEGIVNVHYDLKKKPNKKVYNVAVFNDLDTYKIQSTDGKTLDTNLYFKISHLIRNKIHSVESPNGDHTWYLKPGFNNEWQYNLPEGIVNIHYDLHIKKQKKVYNVEVTNYFSNCVVLTKGEQLNSKLYTKLNSLIQNKVFHEYTKEGTRVWYLKPEFQHLWIYEFEDCIVNVEYKLEKKANTKISNEVLIN